MPFSGVPSFSGLTILCFPFFPPSVPVILLSDNTDQSGQTCTRACWLDTHSDGDKGPARVRHSSFPEFTWFKGFSQKDETRMEIPEEGTKIFQDGGRARDTVRRLDQTGREIRESDWDGV